MLSGPRTWRRVFRPDFQGVSEARRHVRQSSVSRRLRPDVVKPPAQRGRMLCAEGLCVGVVVEEAELSAPGDEHREWRLPGTPLVGNLQNRVSLSSPKLVILSTTRS